MAATSRVVDLTNVKEGGQFRPRVKPEGDYRMKIVKADDHKPGANAKTQEMGWVLTLQLEDDARASYPYYLSPAENQAWKIGGICRAAGLNVKNARVKFDPNKLVNRTVGVFLRQEEYNDKTKSVIDDVFPASEVGANADEEPDLEDEVIVDEDDEEVVEEEEVEVPVKAATRRRKPAPVVVEEEDDEEEEEEPEPVPAPKRRRKPAPAPVVEEDDEEEDEEEEAPAPPPARRRRATKPVAKARTVEPDEDDLDELDTDDLD